MYQAVYAGSGTMSVRTAPERPLARGEVRIAVAYTGICGTDLHIFHGDMDKRVTLPAVIGHEMSGTVVAVGQDVGGWSVGDLTVVLPIKSCGECPACVSGHSHVCHRLDFWGIDSPGAMQEFCDVPADMLVRLPNGMDLLTAALAEPTAVAVHDVRRSGLRQGDFAVVVGGGPVGTLIALVARAAGAQILVAEPDADRRGILEGLGFSVVDPLAVSLTQIVDEWTTGAGAAVVYEVSGSAAGVASAVEVLATRGKLCLVGIHTAPRPIDLHKFFWRELELVGARLYDRSDFETAVRHLDEGLVPVETLVSAVVPLQDVAAAFDKLVAGGVMKVLVDCRSGDDSDSKG